MKHHIHKLSRGTTFFVSLVATALALTACGGQADSADASGGDPIEFEYGAPQDEVSALVKDLEPVTLTYQPPAASPDSAMAKSSLMWKDAIEERSNGQIEIEMIWGQAVAGFEEVPDALVDGRLDMAYTLPHYFPEEYPVYNEVTTATSGMPVSPLLGTLVVNAVTMELGWSYPELLDEFESEGIVPLSPIVGSEPFYSLCAEPGTTASNWEGLQMRIGSSAHLDLMQSLGASPVSMEYVETFEALQRNTVDCTLTTLIPSAEAGLLAVAPHIGYTDDAGSFSGRTSGANLGGPSISELPLAYQQIIFDAGIDVFDGAMHSTLEGTAQAVEMAKDNGGEIVKIEDSTLQGITEIQANQQNELAESGVLGHSLEQDIDEAVERWTSIFEEMGYADGGSFESVDEWYEPDSIEFRPAGERVFEETVLPHRPK